MEKEIQLTIKQHFLLRAKVLKDISNMKDIYSDVVACATVSVQNSNLPDKIKTAWRYHHGQVHVFQTTSLPAVLMLASFFFKRVTESGLKPPTVAFLQSKKGDRFIIAFANQSRFALPVNEATLFKAALHHLVGKYGDNYDYLDSKLLSAVSSKYREAVFLYKAGNAEHAYKNPTFKLLKEQGLV